uniref:UPAR/Ly6 domain-containing protein n=1 Tax=Mus spicilegus TaxID=10103 RepID=A0A8C6HLE5_MUSSI
MAFLVALLVVLGLQLVQSNALTCHVCEAQNSYACSNPSQCPGEKKFCLLAITRIFERFFYVSKQCTRRCPTPVVSPPSTSPEIPEPKEFLIEKPMPFLFFKCCQWDSCNGEGPPTDQLLKEQPGKASERRHSYIELLLPGFMVLTANGLSALCLLNVSRVYALHISIELQPSIGAGLFQTRTFCRGFCLVSEQGVPIHSISSLVFRSCVERLGESSRKYVLCLGHLCHRGSMSI